MRENAVEREGWGIRGLNGLQKSETTIIENPTRQQACGCLLLSDHKELCAGCKIRDRRSSGDANKLLHEQAATELGFSADEFQQLMRKKTDGHGRDCSSDMASATHAPFSRWETASASRRSPDTINVDGKRCPHEQQREADYRLMTRLNGSGGSKFCRGG